jgi:xyloglucan:xyloglucosyl transferase/xyloglucan:xyloglucosyl transferase TCH4
LLLLLSFCGASMASFWTDVDITWGGQRAAITNNGQQLQLSMDRTSGSGFQSKNEYLFGRFDMKIKLVPGNSAGTVTAYYLSSQGPTHDEIDMEFLGNETGQPYTLHTNVYTQGKGNREQQFRLWFDPTAALHTYTILWNPRQVMWYVDGTLIRMFRNHESTGVAYPSKQAMRMYASLWDAEDWATQGGRVKTDWSKAPFVATFNDVAINGCVWKGSASSCGASSSGWMNQAAASSDLQKLAWVQRNYMVYNYCKDVNRFPQGLPPECSLA